MRSKPLPSEGRGREFESRRARHVFKGLAVPNQNPRQSGKRRVSTRQKLSLALSHSIRMRRLVSRQPHMRSGGGWVSLSRRQHERRHPRFSILQRVGGQARSIRRHDSLEVCATSPISLRDPRPTMDRPPSRARGMGPVKNHLGRKNQSLMANYSLPLRLPFFSSPERHGKPIASVDANNDRSA
jgi:hypothetical protein